MSVQSHDPSSTDECFEMLWPPDGYEVKADELEDFVAMLRINCVGVSPALSVDWSEGSGTTSESESRKTDASLDGSAAPGGFAMRIPVEQPAEGDEPEEMLEITVFLKRGSKLWR